MAVEPLPIPGAFRIGPSVHPDDRGCFAQAYTVAELTAVGHPYTLGQVNFSTSHAGVVRGLHGVTIPPGQAKIVACPRGALLDVVVDVRVGSPTFGASVVTRLDDQNGISLYVAEGLAHGFVALSDDTCISYLCSTAHVPGTQLNLNPLDPDLDLPWHGRRDPLVSAKDRRSPTVAQAAAGGLLPSYAACQELYGRNLANLGER